MSRRRRLRSREGSGDLGVYLGIIVAVFILIGLVSGGIYVWKNQEKTLILTENFCPIDGPTHTVIVLIDTTDSLAEITKMSIRQKIEKEIISLPRYAQLKMFNVDQNGLSSAIGAICNPGNKDDLSEWGQKGYVANPEQVQRKYKKYITEAIDTLDALMSTKFEADSSPLLKALQKAYIGLEKAKDYPDMGLIGNQNKIIFATDLLEHTDVFSVYESGPNLDAFRASRAKEKFGINFENVTIEIWQIKRNKKFAETYKIKDFWSSVFKHELDSDLSKIVELPGEL